MPASRYLILKASWARSPEQENKLCKYALCGHEMAGEMSVLGPLSELYLKLFLSALLPKRR